MSKDLHKNEIDLIDVFQILWKEKFKLIFFIAASLIIALILESSKPQSKTAIKASTEIKSISAFDEAQYNLYNAVISRIKPFNDIENNYDIFEKTKDNKKVLMQYGEILENFKIYNIDKEFLLRLFIDKLSDKSDLIDLIKKSDFLNKENYPNLSDYEIAVNSFASSIKINKNQSEYSISTIIFERKDYELFLKFLDTEINKQIQKNLSQMYINNINYINRLKKFRIEDIDLALKNTKNQLEIDQLTKQKNILISNRYIERISDILEDSPISKPNEFYAAKIDYSLTKYETNQVVRSSMSSFYVFGILGLIIGVFFILIANAIQKRK